MIRSIKNAMGLLLILLLLIPVGAEAEPDDSRVYHEPNLQLSSRYRTQSYEAGKEVRLAIPLDNIGRGEARNIYVALDAANPDQFPFDLDRAVIQRRVSSINGNYRGEAVFYLQVRSNAPAGTVSLPFAVTYTGIDGERQYGFSSSVHLQIENAQKPAELIIQNVQMEGTSLQAGSEKVVGLTVKNAGDLALENIRLSLPSSPAAGLTVAPANRFRTLEFLDPDETGLVFFPLRAEIGADDGTVSLPLTMTFRDPYGKTYEQTEEFHVQVAGNGFTGGTLAIEHITVPEHGVSPHTDFPVTFQVRNLSGDTLEGLVVSVDGGETLLPKSPGRAIIPRLESGAAQEMTFHFFAREGTDARNHPLEIRLEPVHGNASSAVVQYTGVLVGGSGAGIPRIIIDRYDYQLDHIPAGESFPLTISFRNTHTGKSVRNIRVSFTSEGDVFSPVGGSNTLYIDRIHSGNSVERELTLRPRPDAGYKIHNLYADIEYEDEDGTAHQTRELVGIPVIQEVRLVFGEAEAGMEAMVGNPLPITLDFYNGGRGLIRNLVISVEGDVETGDGALYIGNMEAGASNYFDATLFPSEPGPLEGKVVFRYDDEANRSHQVEKAFSFQVMEMAGPPVEFPYEEMTMHEQGRRPPWWLILSVLAAGAGGGWWVRKWHQKRKEVDADE